MNNHSQDNDNSYNNGSSSAEWDCPDQILIDELWVRIMLYCCYSIIFTIGVSGNLLVILAVARNKSMQNPTNIFIVNMAVSDILMCLFAVPLTPMHSFMDEWVFGEALCKLFPTSQGISIYMSTLTLTCIAVDRCIAIVQPHRPRLESQTAVRLALGVNLAALGFTAPYAWYMTVTNNSDDRVICTESWSGLPRTLYGAFTNITQFILPFMTIFVCYSVIMYRLAKRMSSRPGQRQNAAKEEAEKERRKKNNRLCVSMVVIFGTCWLPLNVINFIADINSDIFCWKLYHFVFFLCHVLAMSSNCYNPFLYGWLNEAFREEFFKMLPFLSTMCASAPATTNGNNPMATNTRREANPEHISMLKTTKLADPNQRAEDV